MADHDCHEHEEFGFLTESLEMGELAHMKCSLCGRKWEEELDPYYGCHEVVFHYNWATGGTGYRVQR